MAELAEIRERMLALAEKFVELSWQEKPFIPGQTYIPYAAPTCGVPEMQSLIGSCLDFKLTGAGRYSIEFERSLAAYFRVPRALFVNSGSSANLLAISALTSPLLGPDRLRPGDEVITTAVGFPTTLNPILQNGLVPVLIDCSVPGYNADLTQLNAAITNKTRAVVLAHTLGNPFNFIAARATCVRKNLWWIEDACDALGGTIGGRPIGALGDAATFSFYPAHVMTTGEGGAVAVYARALVRPCESLRDWGRECWCAPGKDDTCGKRFKNQFGTLPEGYDHKFVYSHRGYNLRATDMQAALGCSQLRRLPFLVAERARNFQTLYNGLKDLEDRIILPVWPASSLPSWHGFSIGLRAGIARNRVTDYLENTAKIATRPLFGGNLLRQPAYAGENIRTVGNLANSDYVTESVFWVGVYPGITPGMCTYMIEQLRRSLTSV